jgi:hypothetical protein
MVSALQPIIAGRAQVAVQPFFAFSRSAIQSAGARQWDPARTADVREARGGRIAARWVA